jgi:hypothetical protein
MTTPKSDLPTISINKLPSLCLGYPQDSTVGYHPYTFGEVTAISQSNNPLVAFDLAVEGIITSFPKHNLYYFDYIHVATKRKLSSLNSPEISCKYYCKYCGEPGKSVFALDKVTTDDIQAPSLPITVELSVGNLIMKPITIGEFRKLLLTNQHKDRIAILASEVVNHKYADAYKLINGLVDPEDISDIKRVDKLLYFGPKPIEITCLACDNTNKFKLEEDELLTEPFRDAGDTPRDRISFRV